MIKDHKNRFLCFEDHIEVIPNWREQSTDWLNFKIKQDFWKNSIGSCIDKQRNKLAESFGGLTYIHVLKTFSELGILTP